MHHRLIHELKNSDYKIPLSSEIESFASQLGINDLRNINELLETIKYILSREEEKNSKNIDKHNRFKIEESILTKTNLGSRPIVDEILQEIV